MLWSTRRGGKFLFGAKPFDQPPFLQNRDYANLCVSGHPFHVA
jgi:hypothetical protein